MGTLYIVATPIGNLEDITIRGLKILFTVDYIACEDTRRTGQMLKHYRNVSSYPKLISFYDEIEEKKIPQIISLLIDNKDIALVSDSGTPLISDPGFKLVKECVKRSIKIVSIPGPSSVIAALTISSLPINQFIFLGYSPATKIKRGKFFLALKNMLSQESIIKPTVVFFEVPHRLCESLTDLQETFGDINITIARELTKIHEEIFRGKISEALDNFSLPKGEFVILFNILQA